MSEQPPIFLYVVGSALILVGIALIVRPGALVQYFESNVRKNPSSHDPFADFNRQVFNPSNRQRNTNTSRLIGVGSVVMGVLLSLLVYAARV